MILVFFLDVEGFEVVFDDFGVDLRGVVVGACKVEDCVGRFVSRGFDVVRDVMGVEDDLRESISVVERFGCRR